MGESTGKSQDYAETWEGGFIRHESRGRKAYVIRRMINGRNYKVSTRATTLRAAMEQLKRFETDPEHYNPAGSSHEEPIHLDAPLAAEFLAYSRDVDKNSPTWVKKQQGYLAWWADQFKDRDLRKVTLLDDILPALEGAKARGHRIAVLKRVYSWLRKVKHVLSVAEDPTFGRLTVPQARPEQWKRDKVIPREHYLLAHEHLAPHWRDGMDVQAGTGWHVSELVRFARMGSVEPYRDEAKGIAGVLVCPQTKSGEPLRTAVSAEVLEAGNRLLERGSFSFEKYGLAIKGACTAAGIPPFTPGRFRHSVATWALEKGADPASVAAFLNHKSPTTTRRFYATHAVPAKIPTLL
jgi:integrase